MNFFGSYIYKIDMSDINKKIVKNITLNKEDLNKKLL